MSTIKVYPDQKISETNVNVNLTMLGILVFTVSFSTLHTFASSHTIEIALLVISIGLLLISRFLFNKNGIYISVVDIMWIAFLWLFIFNIAYIKTINIIGVIDILVYTAFVLFLILVKLDIKYFEPSMKLIKLFAIIYAFSAIFQYLFTDVYFGYILPLFTMEEQTTIRWLVINNGYSGLTNQTAHLAGYVINGIGVVLYSNWKKTNNLKFISLLSLLILFFGLFLTAKRAHVIFAVISIIITFIISIENKALVKKISKLFVSLIVLVIISFLMINLFFKGEDSPVTHFINDLESTIHGVIEGEDVTSGRSTLYKHSWELFKANPIIGIGWRGFIDDSAGLINSDRGSHPHNIYLQLLTELGLLGFSLFIIPLLYVYYKTIQLIRFAIRDDSLKKWRLGLQFSFYSQTFFILYGMTGNLLTDHNFLLMYAFASSICISALYYFKQQIINKVYKY